MSTNNNNNSDIYGIEKFEGTFEKEELGVTIILNASINEIRNPEALGLYVYLLARPPGWKLNIKHLAEHFECGVDKMYRILNYLLDNKFISKRVIREKGRFMNHHYRVHLSRFEPLVENPIMENKGTYKAKNIKSKEYIKTLSVDSANTTKATKEYKNNFLFMEFYKHYPNKQKPAIAYKAFLKHKPTAEFVTRIVMDVLARIECNWKYRDKSKIPFPATYLNGREWEGEIFTPAKSTTPKSTKYRTMDEIISGDF